MNNQKLIALPELAQTYNIQTINVAYNPKHADAKPTQTTQNGVAYYTLPICLDVLIKNKIWLAYDITTKLITYPQTIIGVGNHWLTTLQDDNKNNRIDINQYLINYER